jgi:hypothetical protein
MLTFFLQVKVWMHKKRTPYDTLKKYVTTQSNNNPKPIKPKTYSNNTSNMKASKQKTIMPLPHEQRMEKWNLIIFAISFIIVLAVYLVLKTMGN